ncbi:hypothetical protein ABT56_18995 [Photobacterium aquae]|uniref:Uncharacterized protein n=1 Tax=Photobacterium aquae TaxID=1195763 RepID=A0A0J1JMY4_9GAMM|nr:hypothetical protein [Photobacterium aquae]KLV03522.1 hypothetical protein ABT56_18995 [Photobacterium aquae]
MNDKIHSLIGVPVNTYRTWKHSRPEYARYLEQGVILLEQLPDETVEALFSSVKTKTINQIMGVEGTFAKSEMNITASTISDWMKKGKSALYVGLLAGAILEKLEPVLHEHGKNVDMLFQSDLDILDLIFVWRNRPMIIPRLLKTL